MQLDYDNINVDYDNMNEEELMLDENQPMEQSMEEQPPMEDQTPRGRAAAIQRWKEANEGAEGDPEDDDLYDFSIGQADEWKSKYDSQNEVNAALANRISEDPKIGAFIAGVMDGKNPAYVLAKLYGNDFLEDEDAMQAMEDGYAEYLEGVNKTKAQQEEASGNFLESMKKVDAYAEANGLEGEVVEELRMSLVQAADDILMGVFSDSFIETVAKGLTYDADVQEAADTGFVEGKNEKVEMKYGRGEEGGMPSMGDATNTPRKPTVKAQEKKDSFWDEMKPVN